MHRYPLRLAIGRQRPVFSHLSHSSTSVQSTTDPATFPVQTYSTTSSSSGPGDSSSSSDNSDPSSPTPRTENAAPISFRKTNTPAPGQKPTSSANAISNLARLSNQSAAPSPDNLVKLPRGGFKTRRVAFIESYVNPEFSPEASSDSNSPGSSVPPSEEIINVRSLPRRGAGLSSMRAGPRRVPLEGLPGPYGGRERPQFGERRSSPVYRSRGLRPGGFRSGGHGTGARGRGRGRGTGRRMRAREPEKEGEKKESLADLLKNADWDPAIRQKWKEEARGQPVSFNPKVQFEDLRGWLPAFPEADKHAHDANVRRALRDLGGGMPYQPEGYVSSMERAERWRFDDKPIFFASKREKHQVKSLDWMIGRNIPGPSDATKKAILDQVIRGNYEAPKYAPVDDIVEFTHSQNVMDRTFRNEDVTKFEDKLKMLLPEYREEMIKSGKLKGGRRQKPRKPTGKAAAPAASKGAGGAAPRAKGKEKGQKQKA